MLEDSQTPILLTKQKFADKIPETDSRRMLCLDNDWGQFAQEQEGNLVSETTPENLAYVIYTSGSTGKPKGALITHYNVDRLFKATDQWFGFNDHDVWTFFHSYAFDFSVWELWGALLYGGTLVMVSYERSRNPEAFFQLLCEQHVTVLNQTPSAFRQLMRAEEASDISTQLALRLVIFGGEALEMQSLQPWFEKHGDEKPRLVNMYGITETTVHVTYRPLTINDVKKSAGSVIGVPIPDLQVYILDQYQTLSPIGVAGELYVGGAGVARGYLNRSELTQERFLSNFLSAQSDTRLYKTGDLARYLPNGDIEYLGRIDQQVKIRGFRIELGEIETALTSYPAIAEATVIVREDTPGEKHLTAYLVPRAEIQIEEDNEEKKEEENTNDYIARWQDIYNETYQQQAPSTEATFNIIGWNSSYTNKPIPIEQMREWVDYTIKRIRSLQPKRVLELGCGTGLLLFRIAPHSSTYWGIDLSQTAINFIHGQLAALPDKMPPITLKQGTADDFSQIPSGAFDTIIINSVIQYFPDVEYLIQVIEHAVNAILPNRGVIFLGDLRSHPLLELFHTSVQFFQAPPSLNATQLRQRVHRQISHENELTLDPALFFALKTRIPAITSVRVQPKRGSARNEMTRFRYDVTLYVNGDGFLAAKPLDSPSGRGKGWVAEEGQHLNITNPPLPGGENYSQPLSGTETHPLPGGEIRWLDWRTEGLTLSGLHQRLKETQPETLGVSNIPNARLFHDLRMRNWLEDRETYASVEEARQALHEHPGESGIDPEDLWNFERKLPEYQIELSWAQHGRDGAFDALFIRRDAADRVTLSFPEPEIAPKAWSAYANDPLRGKHLRTLIPRLRAFIEKKLPDYMVPSAFVLLDALPLTPNGKINRRALPAPERTRPEVAATYVAPANELETVLAKLWEEILDLERLGIHDDFFELGGDSLSMTRMLARLRQDLDIVVTQTDMFDVHTVAQLAEVVERKMHEEIEQLSDEEAAALLADAEQNDIII
ncbi:NdaA protein [Candidatus Moduliflexus flocculans]|uniref:NdaA protein n=1 Tax=Candidatus Moduliflexus flocculans TaxID=1499966 RepID=A0A0S6VXX9_9BACT|nr:NdaA protein [Candidatus Moduliflexus flocculans]